MMSATAGNKPSESESVQELKPTADPAIRQSDTLLRDQGQQEAGDEDIDTDLGRYKIIVKRECMACHRNTPLYSPSIPII